MFVSPSGNDANPGTKDRPFATLERARLDPKAREHVVQCDLQAAGIVNLAVVRPRTGIRAELFFNRQYMTLARDPNDGWLKIADVPPPAHFWTATDTLWSNGRRPLFICGFGACSGFNFQTHYST